ncbi:MFS transporter [Actinoplanes aureus]|uniref:MFS transporter n=1 Tax=Actinoplanes aureus TaxID=2792083 RepID=A0A931CLY3_9ACTN|nr:MFS transporter [Actinoplanes aureus]MBG0567355.1 MFS transporter [Actinoplanes aureus]
MAGSVSGTLRSRRTLIGACLGNAVEWYDFAIYGAFAPVLARAFFPDGGRAALATTFAIFATSFIARPIGAIVVASRSDHLGRRAAFSRTIALMTLATAAIALVPTWSAIGVLAPVVLLLLRLVQGFAVGGEVPTSVAFLIESAPDGHRGWYGGWHMGSIALGLATGYAVAALIAATLSVGALHTWGWRLAFLSAAPLGLVARYIRRRLAETRRFEALDEPSRPHLRRDVLRGRGTRVARGVALVALLSIAFNLCFVYLPSRLATSGSVPLAQTLGAGVLGLLTAAVAAPVLGRLCDRVGRRPLLIAGTVAVGIFAVPGFALAGDSVGGLLVSNVVFGGLLGLLVVTVFVAELFPTAVRATGVAVTYGVATAAFGGTAPLIATLLANAGAAWAAPIYLVVAAVLGLAAALTAAEPASAGPASAKAAAGALSRSSSRPVHRSASRPATGMVTSAPTSRAMRIAPTRAAPRSSWASNAGSEAPQDAVSAPAAAYCSATARRAPIANHLDRRCR